MLSLSWRRLLNAPERPPGRRQRYLSVPNRAAVGPGTDNLYLSSRSHFAGPLTSLLGGFAVSQELFRTLVKSKVAERDFWDIEHHPFLSTRPRAGAWTLYEQREVYLKMFNGRYIVNVLLPNRSDSVSSCLMRDFAIVRHLSHTL
jgi:hypothetical protein